MFSEWFTDQRRRPLDPARAQRPREAVTSSRIAALGPLRPAQSSDYGAFAALYSRVNPYEGALSEDDFRNLAPRILIAEAGGEVIGAVVLHRGKNARVSMVAVAPDFEGRGLAKQMMLALAVQLRSEGTVAWCLRTKRTNPRALALYSSLGLREISSGSYWHLDRSGLMRLPAAPAGLRMHPVEGLEHRKLERTFDLPRGQLDEQRRSGAQILIAENGGRPFGIATLRPEMGNLIFLHARVDVSIRPLLTALWPNEARVPLFSSSMLVCEALRAVDAEHLFETVEMQGPLPSRLVEAE